MDEERGRTLLLVGVCGLAVLVTAATVASPSGGAAGVGGDSEGVGVSEGDGSPLGGGLTTGQGDAWFSFDSMCRDGGFPPGLLGLFGLVILGAGLFGARRDGVSGAVATAMVAAIPILLFLVLVAASCVSRNEDTAEDLGLFGGQASGGGTGVGGVVANLTVPQVAASLLLVALVGAGVLAVVVDRREGEDDDEDDWRVPEREPDREVEYDLDRVGKAAGAAADRLDADADPSNEVYRAWREMTRHLRVERPASSTPAEFTAAATDAGMDPADVAELTDLFEAVRYGGEAPTEERVRRAREALRRIERTYAEGGESE
jgi:hypothetical protein